MWVSFAATLAVLPCVGLTIAMHKIIKNIKSFLHMEEMNQEEINEQENSFEETLTPESKIEELEEKLKDQEGQYLRLYAEFDNFRKRTAKERIELTKVASKDVIVDFLPVLDDIQRAKTNMDDSGNIEAIKQGVDLISEKLWKMLSTKGLAKMEVLGEDFNPDLHEAITEIPAPTEEQKGKVLDVLESGYTLNDKIIRYPKVVVGK